MPNFRTKGMVGGETSIGRTWEPCVGVWFVNRVSKVFSGTLSVTVIPCLRKSGLHWRGEIQESIVCAQVAGRKGDLLSIFRPCPNHDWGKGGPGMNIYTRLSGSQG